MLCIYDNETTISLNNDNITMNSTIIKNDEDLMSNTIFKNVLIACYVLIFLITFIGNLVVILVVLLQKKMRTSTNFFFTNLAFSDLLVALFCIFQNLTSNLQRAWPFGGLMCKMYYFTQTMSYTASIFTMVIISIERYIAICYPLKSKKIFQMRNFQVCILLVWLLSAILCSPNLMLYGVRQIRSGEVCVLQKLQQLVTNTRIFNIINFVLLFLFPMILMSFLYIRLCLKLRTKSFTFIELKKKKINEFFICTESSLISDTNNNNNNSSLLMDGSWSTSKCILKRNNYSLSDFKEDFSRIYQQMIKWKPESGSEYPNSNVFHRKTCEKFFLLLLLIEIGAYLLATFAELNQILKNPL